jgi:hypothetical protein
VQQAVELVLMEDTSASPLQAVGGVAHLACECEADPPSNGGHAAGSGGESLAAVVSEQGRRLSTVEESDVGRSAELDLAAPGTDPALASRT